MGLKRDIQKAISDNTNFRASKVWPIEKTKEWDDTYTWRIEITTKRKPKYLRRKL